MSRPLPLALREPFWVRALLTSIALLVVALFLVLPLLAIFSVALEKGLGFYLRAIMSEDSWQVVRLSLAITAAAVPLNALFGFAAAWAITRFRFPGKSTLLTLIDLPFAVSPIIAGLSFVLLFGAGGWFYPLLQKLGLSFVFAFPGMLLATVFVTFPFVSRELIPLMQELGREEEEAAVCLGAGLWSILGRVTLPNVKWALLYGVILTAGRALGEFGAVSVVSGHIRGETITMPLQVEILYNEYHGAEAFALASLLAFIGVVSLGAKHLIAFLEKRSSTRTKT